MSTSSKTTNEYQRRGTGMKQINKNDEVRRAANMRIFRLNNQGQLPLQQNVGRQERTQSVVNPI